jgi:hypothetical protein
VDGRTCSHFRPVEAQDTDYGLGTAGWKEDFDAMAKAARLGSEHNRDDLRIDAWLGKETRKSDIGLAGQSGSAWMEREKPQGRNRTR